MKNKLAFLFILLLSVSILSDIVIADAIPPWAQISLNIDGKGVFDEQLSIEFLTCENADFQSSVSSGPRSSKIDLNLSIYDPEKGCYWKRYSGTINCGKERCELYEDVPYIKEFKMAIYFPSISKVFITEILQARTGKNEYSVDLSSDSEGYESGSITIVEDVEINNNHSDKLGILSFFIWALVITLILELLVAWIYLSITKMKNRLLLSVIYSNLISVPIVWSLILFMAPVLIGIFSMIIFAEIFAFVFEAYFIYWMNKKCLNLKQSFILSFIMNIVSFLLGGAIIISIGSVIM
ncbi:MAG: hypothetical protein ABIJ08_05170 [Nanoarchaeota archaeon]